MGTVHLAHGHHGLYIHRSEPDVKGRTPLDKEILARPIYFQGRILGSQRQHVIRGALRALMDLPGFDAAVSYSTTEKDGYEHLEMPHREWAEITLGDPKNVVLKLSHDTRFDNHPYMSLLHWLEEDAPKSNLTDFEFEQFCEDWSSPEKWGEFFQKRIKRQIAGLRSEAENLRQESLGLIERAQLIEEALG